MTPEESRKKIEFLERRFQREKNSRIAAESILETKSMEVYTFNQKLVKAVSELEKLTVAVEQSPIIVLITDIKGIVEYVNQSFSAISGYTKQYVIGKNIRSLGLILDNEPMKGIKQVLKNKTLWQGEIRGASTTKQIYKLKISISPILSKTNDVTHFQFNCEDITRQKESEERIYHLAHHDFLTKLHNRLSINDILQQAVGSAERNKSIMSVLFIDMDNFKKINDTHGHKFGDAVLQQVASRLSATCIRKTDYIARIGGDEFLIVLSDIQDTNFIALTAKAIAESLSLPYFIEEQELRSSPSIGIAVYPNDGVSAEELVKNADTAMYHEKEKGKCKYSFFTKELNALIEEKSMLETELRQALDKNELELYYQPQIYIGDTKQFGVEALIRWNHTTLGFVSPEKFIAIAEERGLIYELGVWVIETAFQQLVDWLSVSDVPIKMAINLSAKQIEDKRFVPDLILAISKYGIDPAMIELEITESIAMENPQQSIKTLGAIRAIGFELAIDDFGTGYSSLSYLKHLPIQTLKLDKSFVENLEEDIDNAKICKASISLTHDLGLRFVAEGVETKEQARFLVDNDCDILQGYFFCRPVPAAAAFSFIHSYQDFQNLFEHDEEDTNN
jgi:diguanylate cyclase (GGDEF)-like protein/PAS domain S-box-containing protein